MTTLEIEKPNGIQEGSLFKKRKNTNSKNKQEQRKFNSENK